MSRWKRLLAVSLVLTLLVALICPVLSSASAPEYILSSSELQGKNYADSVDLAKLLDQVFSGAVKAYTDSACTKDRSLPVGCNMNNSVQYYVQSQTTGIKISGWQCYIYANAVYNALFREWVGHAKSFSHSRVVIPGGGNTFSYQMLKDAGVRCGAYLRTTNYSSGAYNGNVGHSLIILSYDKAGITYLEGNADGNGLVRVTKRTWDNFNTNQLSGRKRYISHVVQPKDDFYAKNFTECSHRTWSSIGECTACGHPYNWENSFDSFAAGYYQVTKSNTPSLDGPYADVEKAGFSLKTGDRIHVLGSYRNAFDQLWYAFADEDDGIFYVDAAAVKLESYLPLEINCFGFDPEDGAVLEPKSYPVQGIVDANYPLKTIIGYLVGKQYAQWTAANEKTVEVDIRKTDLNNKLSFAKIAPGEHTVTLKAQSLYHEELLTIHESRFTVSTGAPCKHNYIPEVTKDATCEISGVLTYTCSLCYDTFTRVIAAHGHEYRSGACTHCGAKMPMAQLLGQIVSSGSEDHPVTVILYQEGGQTYTATTLKDSYSIEDILPGSYTLEYSKDGCVTGGETLEIAAEILNLDLRLRAPGDVTLDGKINISDVSKLYAHNRRRLLITDDYALLCADFSGDGKVNVADASKLYSKIKAAAK